MLLLGADDDVLLDELDLSDEERGEEGEEAATRHEARKRLRKEAEVCLHIKQTFLCQFAQAAACCQNCNALGSLPVRTFPQVHIMHRAPLLICN